MLHVYNLRRLHKCFLLCGPKSVGPVLPDGLDCLRRYSWKAVDHPLTIRDLSLSDFNFWTA